MSDVYDLLAKELSNFEIKPKEEFGYLGYNVDGQYSVFATNRPTHYRVVLDTGQYVEVEHRGKVQPIPGLRVIVRYDDRGVGYIHSTDATWLSSQTSAVAVSANVGPHSHHRGSGMEFPIDTRLLTNFFVKLMQGLVLQIDGGFYYVNNELRYCKSTSIDLQSYRPSTINTHCWVLFLIDTMTDEIIFVTGTPKTTTLALSFMDLTTIPYDKNSQIPIFAVKLRFNTTQILDSDLTMLQHLHVLCEFSESSAGPDTEPDIENEVYFIANGPLTFNNSHWVGKDI